MESGCDFAPDLWASSPQQSPTTTNTAESFNSHLDIVLCLSVFAYYLLRFFILRMTDTDDVALLELQIAVMFTFNIMSSSVRLSSVCLSSVTFVRPTQAIEIFGNISTPFGTLAIPDLSVKISQRSSQRNSFVGD